MLVLGWIVPYGNKLLHFHDLLQSHLMDTKLAFILQNCNFFVNKDPRN